MTRQSVPPDFGELFAAMLVAPLGAVLVVGAFSLAGALGRPPRGIWDVMSAIGAMTMMLFPMALFVVPVAWVVTFVAGLPIVMMWCKVRGGISATTTVAVGALLGGSLILIGGLLQRHAPSLLGVALFACCGAATAFLFWFIALRTAA
jgi:hypothetical protein